MSSSAGGELDFDEPRLADAVERLSPDAVNALPFGAVRLDPEGKVTFYSDAERRLSGYRKNVVGHLFFADIAPCLNNPNFHGRIERALAEGKLDITSSYTAELPVGVKDLNVRVQSVKGGGCWMFLQHEPG
jgi:photoactive yellow protein